MPLIKFILPLFILVVLSACAGNKKVSPKKKDINTSTSYTYLGTLSPAQEIVKKELIDYLKDIEAFNVESIVEKTYPKLFQVINEQHFREYISTMMNSKDIMIEHYDTNITHLSKVKTFSNGTQFCQVDYSSNAKLSLLNNNLYKSEESMNYLYDVLIHKYGKKNILFDIKERSISIKREEKLIVIKEQDEPWKFIGDNLNYRRVYADILPREILSNLDK